MSVSPPGSPRPTKPVQTSNNSSQTSSSSEQTSSSSNSERSRSPFPRRIKTTEGLSSHPLERISRTAGGGFLG